MFISVLSYDSDDPKEKKKEIGSLAPLDHSKIKYPEYNKDFYEEAKEIAEMPDSEVRELKKKLGTLPIFCPFCFPHCTVYRHKCNRNGCAQASHKI